MVPKRLFIYLLVLVLFAAGCSTNQSIEGLWLLPKVDADSYSWLELNPDGTFIFRSTNEGTQQGAWELRDDVICIEDTCMQYSLGGEQLSINFRNETFQNFVRFDPDAVELGQPEELTGNWSAIGDDFTEFDFLPNGVFVTSFYDFDLVDLDEEVGIWGLFGDELCIQFYPSSADSTQFDEPEQVVEVKIEIPKFGTCGSYSIDQGYLILSLVDDSWRLRRN